MQSRYRVLGTFLVGVTAFVVVVLGDGNRCCARQAISDYSALLEQAVEGAGAGRGGFRLVGWSAGRTPEDPVPRCRTIAGLDDANAVPFLIDVLKNGPPWDESLLKARGGMFPHIARCLAALNLGKIGDSRAYEPLLNALQHGDFLEDRFEINDPGKDRHHISFYAALALGYLGDDRAVEPLIAAMGDSTRLGRWAAGGLTQLGDLRVIKPIVAYLGNADQDEIHALHNCLERLTRTNFDIRGVGETLQERLARCTIRQFPELGELDRQSVYQILWQHWLEEGDSYARKTFELYYPAWVRTCRESPGDRDGQARLLSLMTEGGVATMPFIMAEIEKGDDSLIPAVEYLETGDPPFRILERPLAPNARAECLEWWAQNKEKWTLFDSGEVGSRMTENP